jgi:integrase
MTDERQREEDNPGRWEFFLDLPTTTGRRRQVHRRGFATRREAQDALDRVRSEVLQGTYVPATPLTVAEYLSSRWLPAKRATLKPSTFASYRTTLDAHVLPRIGTVELAKVDPSTLNRLYADLLEDGRTGASGRRGGLSPKTVRNIHATAAIAAGVPVKVLSTRLGHADIAITLRVYAHLLPGQDEAAADLVAGLIRGATAPIP